MAHGVRVVGIDLLPVEPVNGATLLRGDFTKPDVQAELLDALREQSGSGSGVADLLLSDVSPNRSGNASLDEAGMVACAEASLSLAARCLRPGGSFVCKLLEGSDTRELVARAKPMFKAAGGLVKPKASRPKSREVYLVARGFDPDAYASQMAAW